MKSKGPRDITENDQYINICIYGDPGVGKTPLAATSGGVIVRPPHEHVQSVLSAGLTAKEWVVQDWNDMDDVYEYARHEDHGIEWWWLDSVSLWQEQGLFESIMVDLVAEKPHRDPDIPDQKEYLQNFNRLKKWVRHMSALPIHFGWTAHRFRVEDDDGEVTYWPWVQGKEMPQALCGYMNMVGALLTQEDKEGKTRRILLTDHVKKHYGKDQFHATGGKLVDPTIPKLEELVQKAISTNGAKNSKKGKKSTKKKPPAKKAAGKKTARKPSTRRK